MFFFRDLVWRKGESQNAFELYHVGYIAARTQIKLRYYSVAQSASEGYQSTEMQIVLAN